MWYLTCLHMSNHIKTVCSASFTQLTHFRSNKDTLIHDSLENVLMLSLVHTWIVVKLSCIVCLSQVSPNCKIYRMRLPGCWQVQSNLTTSLLCWNHYSGSLWRRESISMFCFLYIVPHMIRRQNIREICSRRELMFEHCIPQPPAS